MELKSQIGLFALLLVLASCGGGNREAQQSATKEPAAVAEDVGKSMASESRTVKDALGEGEAADMSDDEGFSDEDTLDGEASDLDEEYDGMPVDGEDVDDDFSNEDEEASDDGKDSLPE